MRNTISILSKSRKSSPKNAFPSKRLPCNSKKLLRLSPDQHVTLFTLISCFGWQSNFVNNIISKTFQLDNWRNLGKKNFFKKEKLFSFGIWAEVSKQMLEIELNNFVKFYTKLEKLSFRRIFRWKWIWNSSAIFQ